ncbi:MAG TPA: hypothetical protein VGL18_13110 [Actinomycetota bacterium]
MTRRALSGFLTVLFLAGACTGAKPSPVASGSRSPSASASAGVSPSASPAKSAGVDPLCKPPPPEKPSSKKGGGLPRAIAKIADQVQEVRGLSFKRPVSPEPVSRQQMARMLTDSYEENYPKDQAAAEGRALVTMGALPAGTDLYKAVLAFGTSQILGFYDTQTHRLVFQSNKAFSPLARFTLSHELTHALQDQNFGLGRLDRLNRTCRDDRAEAFLSLIEGDAVVSQIRWARANLSNDEIQQIQSEAARIPPPPASVPRFVQEVFGFPYDAGQVFVQDILARGGLDALDAALRHPPISTEQVLHPAKYPKDTPRDVHAPDISARLGKGWKAIDFSDVGEGFLREMFQLELPAPEARQAAAGWDGGQYRAFGKGARTAVLLTTVWDTGRDAREFSDTMQRWVRHRRAKAVRMGASVNVLFASDAATLRLLETAVG